MKMAPSVTILPDSLNPAEIIDHPVMCVWILNSGKAANDSTRGWHIAVETIEGDIFTIVPRVNHGNSSTMDIILQPLRDSLDTPKSNTSKDFTIATGCAMHYGRAAVPGKRIADFTSCLVNSGITAYALNDGRGMRFWLLLALHELQGLWKEPRAYDRFTQIAMTKMKYTGSKDMAIEVGKIVPHKLTASTFQYYKDCKLELVRLEKRAAIFGF